MRTIAIVVILSLTGSAEAALAAKADQTAAAQETNSWRKVAETIPLGSRVKVQTLEGRNITGTLMRVDGDAILVKRNTRRPEPAITLAFDEMSRLERDQNGGGGVNVAKAFGIALATGGAIVLSLFLVALQLD
jgi:hypothetical protein